MAPFSRMTKLASIYLIFVLSGSCTQVRPRRTNNPYEDASEIEAQTFKKSSIPLPPKTRFKISQGAFGSSTHNIKGYEYAWDFDVPFGTEVIATEDGRVIQVYEPVGKGACDPKKNDVAHNIKILLRDGTVAQYVHIQSKVKIGDEVKKGQTIAVTSNNGYLCTPQLHFNFFRDQKHLPENGNAQTIPVYFEGRIILKSGDTDQK